MPDHRSHDTRNFDDVARRYDESLPAHVVAHYLRKRARFVSGLQPGPTQLGAAALNNPYEGNAWAVTQGQQLFSQYNCAGCHFHGGGGIGPALMDAEWIYGSSPANIYTSIAEGRPNGMPSFGGHIPDFQIWQITTYVRSVANLEPHGATPTRSEGMQAKR